MPKRHRSKTAFREKQFQLIGQSWHVEKTCRETIGTNYQRKCGTLSSGRRALGRKRRTHPLAQGLLKALREPESEWPSGARKKWLQTAAHIFDLIYKGDGGGIEVILARADQFAAAARDE
jgi:hypothetical protein